MDRNNSANIKGSSGIGIAFPLRLDDSGQIAKNSLEDHVHQSIMLILKTSKDERIMYPEFGSRLNEIAFLSMDASTAALMKYEVEEALTELEPRIEILNTNIVFAPKKNGVLLINLEYKLKETDTVHNLSYPLSLERGEA